MFFWYLVHCFVIPIYRSSSSFVSIDSFVTELWSLSYPGFTINMIDIACIMRLEYCCSPIIFVIGRGLCIAMQYSQNACFFLFLDILFLFLCYWCWSKALWSLCCICIPTLNKSYSIRYLSSKKNKIVSFSLTTSNHSRHRPSKP